MSATKTLSLTANERLALELLIKCGGSMLESGIPDCNERDVFGDVTPGQSVYKRLEKRGLIFFTEEEPLDLPGDPLDGFTFTREIYLTDDGHSALSAKQ